MAVVVLRIFSTPLSPKLKLFRAEVGQAANEFLRAISRYWLIWRYFGKADEEELRDFMHA
jgi:hypothetical protein